jgi:L-alanine-DL-glutamate epimerase-like enolase superfamily enzyme
MLTPIASFQLTRIAYPRSRIIGDSQVRSSMHWIGVLELVDQDGRIGVGFFGALFAPLPPLSELNRAFEAESWPGLNGQLPAILTQRVTRPRGGNIRGNLFGQAVDQAIWDLHAQQLGLPLARLLGASRDRVPAYASGLEFHLPTDQACAFFAAAKQRGFRAFKFKVGHPDLAWDIARLQAFAEVVGSDAKLMIDANEAWSPKEAIRRVHAYREAGLHVTWVEDPCLRDDYTGLAEVRRALPFAQTVCGEYLDLHGKRLLLEHRATDILHTHGAITESMRAGWLAAEYGVPVAFGNTPFEVGVHLAAALPEVVFMEYSFLDYNQLLEQPIQFEDGYALVPDRPGHGLALSAAARSEYARPFADI